MMLETGKYYVDGYGAIQCIESRFQEGMWTTSQNLFRIDGQYFNESKSKRDLIMEINIDDYKVFLQEQMNRHIGAKNGGVHQC